MCFYNDDCDWVANVQEESFLRATKPDHCIECGKAIAPGEWCRTVFQQENEECVLCEDSGAPDFMGDRELWDTDEEFAAFMAECKHDYGETFSATICRGCSLILEAIYDLEQKEGCPEYARQPAYGELQTELHEDGGKWGEQKYAKHAVALFPELATHSLIAQ